MAICGAASVLSLTWWLTKGEASVPIMVKPLSAGEYVGTGSGAMAWLCRLYLWAACGSVWRCRLYLWAACGSVWLCRLYLWAACGRGADVKCVRDSVAAAAGMGWGWLLFIYFI
jgi:hypothetical protein